MTPEQNNALHLWFEHLAAALNDAGQDVQMVMAKKTLPLPWTKTSVKELLFRPTMQNMTGKDSVTQINKIEPSDICEALSRALIQNDILDEYIPFPSKDHAGQETT